MNRRAKPPAPIAETPLPKMHPVVERLREILGPEIAVSSIHAWIQRGIIPTVKIGKKRYVTDENLRAFLTGVRADPFAR